MAKEKKGLLNDSYWQKVLLNSRIGSVKAAAFPSRMNSEQSAAAIGEIRPT